MSKIQWTDRVWNPVVGCTRVSAGCERCYAERVAHRGMQEAHRGLTVAGVKGPRWNGTVRCLPERLDVRKILRARKGDNPSEWPRDLRRREFPSVGSG